MQRPLQILQINNRIPWPLNDGGNIATWNVTNELHRQGHQITFAALNTSKHYQDPKVMSPICDIHTVDIDTRLTPLGLVMGLIQKMPYNVRRFASADFSEMLERILRHQTFDVIQIEGIYMALYADVIRRATDTPLVLRAHNVEHRIWERLADRERNPLKRSYLRQLARKIRVFEKESCLKFDGIAAITEDDATWFLAQGYKGGATTIPAGVDGQKFVPPKVDAAPGTVAFLGSLEWMPNLEGLRWLVHEVWPYVHIAVPTSRLDVAGKNPPSEVRRWEIPGMTFHGEVADAPEFLGRSGILAVPLHSGGGMRLKVVEAMAAGRCVISTPVGVEGIKCTPGVDVLVADGAESFREALMMACKDPELVARIGARARETALREYGWEPLIHRLVDFYGKLHRR